MENPHFGCTIWHPTLNNPEDVQEHGQRPAISSFFKEGSYYRPSSTARCRIVCIEQDAYL
jgi:hypothetical protein